MLILPPPILITFFVFLDVGEACQPPMPAAAVGFQNNALPISQPSFSQFPPPSLAAGTPLDQSAPVPPPPAPPAPSDADSNSISISSPGLEPGFENELEMINAPALSTPFPGFVAPPPPPPPASPSSAASSSPFPKLLDKAELAQLQSHVHQKSSNTFESETPLQLLVSESKKDYSCPQELTSLPDFLTCVRRLSTVTLDERNMNCDFEKDSGCRFKSISSPLSVGNFPTADHYRTFATLASRPEAMKPHGNFVFFIEHRGAEPEDQFIISTPIVCQKGNGVLKFDYWIVGKQNDVILRVCTQNHLARSCTQSIAYNPASSTIAIEVVHPNSTFFELEIVASNLVEPTIIVYDNIDYKSEMCEWDQKKRDDDANEKSNISVDSFFDADEPSTIPTDGAEAEPTPSPRLVRLSPKRMEVAQLISDLSSQNVEDDESDEQPASLCKLLDCEFTEDLCGFTNYVNESMMLSPWQIGAQKVGNPHTGVKDGSGGFAYVGTDNPGPSKLVNYILESPDLSVNEDFHISIDIYRRSNDITLQICLDTPFYCPYHVSPFEKDEYWKEGELFVIPKGTLKIYLKAIQWRKFKWLAVDNFKVISNKC